MSVPRVAFLIHEFFVVGVEEYFTTLINNHNYRTRHNLRLILLNDNNAPLPERDRRVSSIIASKYKYDLNPDRKMV
jgi:hypothetical protein